MNWKGPAGGIRSSHTLREHVRQPQDIELSINEYLEACKTDPSCYAGAHERLLSAIGEPQVIDTAKDPRLGRIFMNRTIRQYPAFSEFYGMEETVERIVSFFRHAAQGLEERKQILYLLGPVGGGKSSLAERLKALMEVNPIYVLKAGDQLSRFLSRRCRCSIPTSWEMNWSGATIFQSAA